MPYTVEYRPTADRPSEPWARVDKEGHIVSRHRSRKKAKAAIRAYYANRHAENCLICNARTNTLKVDPTRTLSIRRKFIAEMNKAFRNLQGHVREFLVVLDALGLKEKKLPVPFSRLIGNVQPREFQFLTDEKKLSAFNDWFRQQVEADVLSPDVGTPIGQPWTTEFVESAYRRGQLNAFLSSRQITGSDQSSESFLRSSFGQPETMSKVRLLGTRAFEQLRGVTSTMGSEMNRILAQGIADGSGPDTLAREMAERIGSLTRSRALVIARTEVINAHAEGQLDAFEKLDVKELGVKAEWSTAGDERVCELCFAEEGKVFTVDEARGLIPLHPNCRCTWIPAVPKMVQ